MQCLCSSLNVSNQVSHPYRTTGRIIVLLRVFENRVLRRVFGPKRDEVTGEWRKLHNEELSDVLLTQYCAGGKIEKNEMGGARGVYGGGKRCAQGSDGET